MTFAEKLKSIRKQTGMSQEQLAGKLGVSRQAITKWETGAGIPDIENIMAVSALFDISIDELLSNEKGLKKLAEYLYESITEYDIDEPKRYDMKLAVRSNSYWRGMRAKKSVYVLYLTPCPRSRMILRSGLTTSENGLMWM